MRIAGPADVADLLDLMEDFYAEAGFELDRAHAGGAFRRLLSDPSLGTVWVIERDGRPAGYAVLTFVFSMEYGGTTAVLDDLFVKAVHRRGGLGGEALQAIQGHCAERGVRALRVETGRENEAASALYRRAGFEVSERQLLTLALDSPVHR